MLSSSHGLSFRAVGVQRFVTLHWHFSLQLYKQRWNLNVNVWLNSMQDMKQQSRAPVNLSEEAAFLPIFFFFSHLDKKKKSLSSTLVCCFLWKFMFELTPERGTFWTANHSSRIWYFHLSHSLCRSYFSMRGAAGHRESGFSTFFLLLLLSVSLTDFSGWYF